MTTYAGVAALLLSLGAAAHALTAPSTDADPRPDRGRGLALLALGLCCTVSTVVIAHGDPAVRVPVALVSGLLGPGYAIVVRWELADPLDELCLAFGLGLTVLVFLGTTMVTFGWWLPGEASAALSLVTGPVLVRHATRRLRPVRPDRHEPASLEVGHD